MKSFSSFPSVSDVTPAHQLGRWFAAARRAGLLALLPPEVWHTLLALLSFTTQEGRRVFTLDHLTVALGQPREEALARLERLAATTWRGEPLATLERDPEGTIVGAVLAPIEILSGDRAPQLAVPDAPSDETATAEGTDAGDLGGALQEVGLNPDQIAELLRSFPYERIQRQLAWLPGRHARNPPALLIRAVEQNWSAPREVG